jgi:SAM-dependent methyltransferase
VGGADACNPREYWAKRLSNDCSLGTVGLLGAGVGWNQWLYAVRRAVLLKTVRRHGIAQPGMSVLELGAGSGFYVPVWERCGACRIVGVDLTEHSVRYLKHRHPRRAFLVQDIGVPFDLNERFDVVTAFDVMFHILDDQSHQVALTNAARHVAPGGHLLVTDVRLRSTALATAAHVRFRSLSAYGEIMPHVGMRLVSAVPVFVTMVSSVNPCGGIGRLTCGVTGRLCGAILRRLTGRPKDMVGYLLGAIAYPLELMATAVSSQRPSIELLVYRRSHGSVADAA